MSLTREIQVTMRCSDCKVKIKSLYIRDPDKLKKVGKICPKCKAVRIDD